MNRAAVVGGGPAGLMAAEVMAAAGLPVTLYDQMPSVGRKFLLAGRGGLNLTHSEPLHRVVGRYGAAQPVLGPMIEVFGPAALRAWCEALGQSTFVGSSGRVFPVAMKATPLLRAWLVRLRRMGVEFRTGYRFVGWEGAGLRFETADRVVVAGADVVVLALGGGSWPRLGSDGRWVPMLEEAGAAVAPLQAANCGFLCAWSPVFRDRFAGEPLKRIAASFNGVAVRGEAVVTRDGIEGGAVYALSGPLRDAIAREGSATLLLDLRPDLEIEGLAARLGGRGLSTSNAVRRAGLAPVVAGLLREVAGEGGLAERIKALPLQLVGVQRIGRAISTAGGVLLKEVDELMLRARPGVFLAGEMLDWEAPTGGYLLQACFSTGHAAGLGAVRWLLRTAPVGK